MLKANIAMPYSKVTCIGNNIIFNSCGLKVSIEDIDMMKLIEEIKETGYLKEYMEKELGLIYKEES